MQLLLAGNLRAQTTVSGTVTDTKNTPLQGVSISIKGSAHSTLSDQAGHYSIKAPSPQSVLLFSFVGYLTKEEKLEGRSNVNISLTDTATVLGDVVVVGFGTQRKGSITGSVGVVKGSDITNNAVNNVGQALQGKVAGVQITRSSGQPGAGVDIRIRGEGTLNSGKGPLVIIDGVEGGNINNLSPRDIESITVLKDASASAIYGSRAASGVIVITTKHGVPGKTEINYSYNIGTEKIARMPRLLSAHDFVRLQNEALINANNKPTWTDDQIAAFGAGTNWLDAVLQNGLRQEHNISLSGGAEKVRYLLSANYQDEKGIVKYSLYKRISGRFNLDAKVTSRLSVGLNAFIYNTKQRVGPDLQTAIEYVPTIPVTNPDGTPGYRNPDGPTNAENGGLNPLQSYLLSNKYNTNLDPTTGTNSSLYIEYAFTPHLKFRATGGLNLSYEHNKIYSPSYSIIDNKGATVAEVLPQNATLTESDGYIQNWILNNTLTYTHSFGKHNIAALAGYSEQYYEVQTNQLTRKGFPSNDFNVIDAGGSANDNVAGNTVSNSLRSFFGRINYDYQSKYLLELVGRYDGSSRFSPKNKYGFFPSASIGWRISNENFFLPLRNTINDLKLRASYGAIGNESIGNYAYMQIISLTNSNGTPTSYILNNTPVQGVAYSGMSNPNIKWETSLLSNIGLDMSLLNNKLTITIEAYNKLTKNILTNISVPATTGNFSGDIQAGTQVRNVGKVRNRGIELAIGYSNSIGKDLRYSISASGSYNQNRVLELGGVKQLFGGAGRSVTMVGKPMLGIWGWQVAGIWQNQDEINKNPHQPNDQPGDLRLVNLNGDSVIDGADQTYLGSFEPVYTVGLNGNISYKGFDFTVSTQGDFGQKLLRYAVGGYFELAYTTRNNFDYVLNRWHGEGTSNLLPRVINSEYNTGQATSLRVQDASYFKIRHVELGYTLPETVMKKIKLSRVRVYLAAENLLTFTPFVGLDPERTPSTNDAVQRQNESYPQARMFVGGISVNF